MEGKMATEGFGSSKNYGWHDPFKFANLKWGVGTAWVSRRKFLE